MPFPLNPRIQNIFNQVYNPYNPNNPGMQQPVKPALPAPIKQAPSYDLPDIQTPLLDAYYSHVNAMPQRGSPGFWNRLLAGMSGASAGYFGGPMKGVEAAQATLDMPYDMNLKDWALKGQGLKEAASLENRNISQENTRLRNSLYGEIGLGRNDIAKRYNDARAATAQFNAETARQKLGLGDWELIPSGNNNGTFAHNKVTNETKFMPDVNLYDEPEKAQAALEKATKVAGIAKEAALGAARIRATASENVANANAQADRDVAETNAASRETVAETNAAGRGPNASWEKYNNSQALGALALAHPEYAQAGLIGQTKQGVNYLTVPPEPTFFGKDEYNKMLTQFRQDYDSVIKSPAAPSTAPTARPSRVKPTASKTVKMQAPNGQVSEVPVEDVAHYLALGAKRVK